MGLITAAIGVVLSLAEVFGFHAITDENNEGWFWIKDELNILGLFQFDFKLGGICWVRAGKGFGGIFILAFGYFAARLIN